MKNSLQDSLINIYPLLTSKITNSDSLFKIINIAQKLPNVNVISDVMFESNLTKGESTTDISIVFDKLNRHLIIDSFPSLLNLANKSNPWKKFESLIQKWIEEGSSVYNNVEHIWLEFDTGAKDDSGLEPSLFFYPLPSSSKYNKPFSNFARYEWIICDVIELLMDDCISMLTRQNLQKCFDLLPENSEVFDVGVMLPRVSESKLVRLCIRGIKTSEIIEYLYSIGWNGSIEEMCHLLNELSTLTDSILISISVGDDINSRIGLECYIDKKPQSIHRWQMFFDFMIKKKLCTFDQASEIMSWPGHMQEKSCQEVWPSNNSNILSNAVKISTRVINHVKIVYQPKLEAKAYLRLSHYSVEYDALQQEA